MAGQWARRPRTTSGRMFPLAAACSRHTHQLQIRPAYGLDGRAVMLIDRYDGRRRRPRRSRWEMHIALSSAHQPRRKIPEMISLGLV